MAFPWRYVDSMAIPWSPSQLECVNAAIGAHPAESGRCAELARQVAPVARELDPEKIAGPGDGDAVERATWTVVARVVLNLDEAVTNH